MSEILVALPERTRIRKPLPQVDCKWLDEHVCRTTNGLDCIDRHALRENASAIGIENWCRWLYKANPDLARTVRGFVVPSHPATRAKNGRETTIVWVQDDVELALQQRRNPRARKSPPDQPGYWLTAEIWQDKEYGKCLREKALAQCLKRSVHYLNGRRRRRHPALDANVNGGKPRFRKVPKFFTGNTLLKRTGNRRIGEGPVIVSCLSDFEKIAEWDSAQVSHDVPAGWKLFNEIAEILGFTSATERLNLGFALRGFREERSDKAGRAWGPERRPNQMRPPWRYDPEVFLAWLNGRTVQEAGKPFRRRDNSKTNRNLSRAILFLQFVLTQGKFSVRRFNSFAAYPPTEELLPCGPVPKKLVEASAKRLGIGIDKTLEQARRHLGVKFELKGFGANMKSYWSLPGPIRAMPVGQPSATNGQSSAVDTVPEKTGTPSANPSNPVSARSDGASTPKRRPGRPPGGDPDVQARNTRIVDAWKAGQYESIAELARAFDVQRSYASNVLKDAGVRA